ncbi:MAG TPA: peptide ABC transporter substrate-binding protein [Gammaproteobacteria bacterium]|nr:peptide ABC transporter substrate-binding protein [Gammaproteobacteria bacterium]
MLVLAACSDRPWNNPYPPADDGKNILYQAFSERPKHLDPVRSYSSNEYSFLGQIVEPPLHYHYLDRPYRLAALTAKQVPVPDYYDQQDQLLPADARLEDIAYSVYEIVIQPGIQYQPHPAFARDEQGELRYQNLTEADLTDKWKLSDFSHSGSRELVAADYVYQIKRLAHPRLDSPIYSIMSEYIVGLTDYAKELKQVDSKLTPEQDEGRHKPWLDLTKYPLQGVQIVDRYRYRIRIKGKYPQFLYWLAMPFFAPTPPEVDRFYAQPGMKQRNISMDWYPVGTGAYMLSENNPNLRMVMVKNPNFRGMAYPARIGSGKVSPELLVDAGKPMPFIDKVVYSLEKETIPYWSKFLQGYYDLSGISSDSFDQAVQFNVSGEVNLTDAMQKKGIRLLTEVQSSTMYMGFNMIDPVVGGDSERARLLRRAISIAIDYEEFIRIFRNGRGLVAQSLLPPGIIGFQEGEQGMNPYIFDWVNGKPRRKSVDQARQLLAQAGYPQGRDAKTGQPLVIYLDIAAGGPDDKAMLDWFRKQFARLDLQLSVRNTDYNRFQEKMRKGNAQLFMWGWNADYPDPENFMFLLYGPNSRVKHAGENAANYSNPEFDVLFDQMKNMDNGPERIAVINRMLEIIRADAPWIWGYHPKQYVLHHSWYGNAVSNLFAHNTLMYKRIDARVREQKRRQWNQPVIWPIFAVVLLLVLSLVPGFVAYRRKEHRSQRHALNSSDNQTGKHS